MYVPAPHFLPGLVVFSWKGSGNFESSNRAHQLSLPIEHCLKDYNPRVYSDFPSLFLNSDYFRNQDDEIRGRHSFDPKSNSYISGKFPEEEESA